MKEQKYIIEDVKSFEPKHMFECGQCFRWNLEEDGSYTGAWEQFNKVNPDKYSIDKLNELYINSNSLRKSIRNVASAELNAYMNYVMLQEFDTILRNNLKTIVID